jgi:hypothetical protein
MPFLIKQCLSDIILRNETCIVEIMRLETLVMIKLSLHDGT